MGERKLITVKDIIIISALSAVFAVLIFSAKSGGGEYAEIAVDGNVIMTVPLSTDGEYRPEVPEYPLTVTVKDGKAAVTESGCPNKFCVGRGAISADGEMIVCLPNRLTVTVKSGKKSGYDVIV